MQLDFSKVIFFSTLCFLIIFVSTTNFINAQSELETRAEAQFEFYKYFNDLQKRIIEKNPQTYDEIKQISHDYILEKADHIKNLKPAVKQEFCTMISDTANFLYGVPIESGVCELILSNEAPNINHTPTVPYEECKYVMDPGTKINIPAQVNTNFIMQAELAKDQLALGDNQTVKVHTERVPSDATMENTTMQNTTVRITMSDSSGRAIHSVQGKTDAGGNFYHSWKVDVPSPGFYTVTVMAKDPANPNWSSGTLWFNRSPNQLNTVRICPGDDQRPTNP